VTHPTSGQHRTHIKKLFIPNYLSKGYPSHVKSQSLINFFLKMCFDVENKCIRKKFQKCHMKDFFDQEHKSTYTFWDFFLDVNFLRIHQMPTYLMCFIDN